MKAFTATILCALFAAAVAQPYLPGLGLLPAGNARTTDGRGPNAGGTYDLTQLATQENQLESAAAFRANYSDLDIVHFLTNVECLEGLFDTWGTFGFGFTGNLEQGGPIPNGVRKVPMDTYYQLHMEEIALNEQGHAAFTRAADGTQPCPAIDYIAGWNAFMGAAYGLPAGQTIESVYGTEFDPFQDQQTYITLVLTLEELGATGNLGLSNVIMNPVIASGVGGLATSATAHATVERMLLWQLRNETIAPFNETVQQVFARISALRDSLDGPQFDDQGLVNTDARTIAVPTTSVNMVPTNIYGLTFTRTPTQLLNILFLGNTSGRGVFFPDGVNGAINSSAGYADKTNLVADIPVGAPTATQQSAAATGPIMPPITASGPATVPNQDGLTQWLGGAPETTSPNSRGGDLSAPASGPANAAPNFVFQTGVTTNPASATGGR